MSLGKPEFVVFYAWQSDRPANQHRYLIREADDLASQELNAESAFPFTIRIDQDTEGVPGLCDIPATILRKIDEADAFIADLTYVAFGDADSDGKRRHCSNPNVLFELGYAFRSLGFERIICVMNEHYGPVAEQIFDLAHRRFPLAFRIPADGKSRKDIVRLLQKELVVLFRSISVVGKVAKDRRDVDDKLKIEFDPSQQIIRRGDFTEIRAILNNIGETRANRVEVIVESLVPLTNQNNASAFAKQFVAFPLQVIRKDLWFSLKPHTIAEIRIARATRGENWIYFDGYGEDMKLGRFGVPFARYELVVAAVSHDRGFDRCKFHIFPLPDGHIDIFSVADDG